MNTNEMVAKLKVGDTVQVKYGNRWHKETFTISHTWYTPENGRQYNVRENGDTFKQSQVRLAK